MNGGMRAHPEVIVGGEALTEPERAALWSAICHLATEAETPEFCAEVGEALALGYCRQLAKIQSRWLGVRLEPSLLEGLLRREVIERVVMNRVRDKAWRTVAERDALTFLLRAERNRRGDVVNYVRAAYDAAGAGLSGRWQDSGGESGRE